MDSTLFEKAREYVEANHDAWYILSAKHHLLDPDGPHTEPYDETLSCASVARKRKWSRTIFNQLKEEGLLADGNRLVIHAGRAGLPVTGPTRLISRTMAAKQSQIRRDDIVSILAKPSCDGRENRTLTQMAN